MTRAPWRRASAMSGARCSRLTFVVVEAPAIEIAGLEEACVGEPVFATLSASGGARAGDVWSAQSEALELGLRLEGNTIVGAPSRAGVFAFDVTLDSGLCQPVSRRVLLPPIS